MRPCRNGAGSSHLPTTGSGLEQPGPQPLLRGFVRLPGEAVKLIHRGPSVYDKYLASYEVTILGAEEDD